MRQSTTALCLITLSVVTTVTPLSTPPVRRTPYDSQFYPGRFVGEHVCTAPSSLPSSLLALNSAIEPQIERQIESQIELLDHLNINHAPNTHPSLLSFYKDTLGFTLDERKLGNVKAGKGTVWVNAGANQLHLSEGKLKAQVVDGKVRLNVFSEEKLRDVEREARDKGFFLSSTENEITLTCPYGNVFELSIGPPDPRGSQPGSKPSETVAGLREIELHVSSPSDLAGVEKFYASVFGCETRREGDSVNVPFGPLQSLRFTQGPIENDDYEDGTGPHVSLYVRSLPSVWDKAEDLGLVYVNPRFKRKAHTLEEARKQCMFRVLWIVDPEDGRKIMRLEHEIRR